VNTAPACYGGGSRVAVTFVPPANASLPEFQPFTSISDRMLELALKM
jgi:hypothetical protein